jgi:RNA polymerase-binding transcription factor DksA
MRKENMQFFETQLKKLHDEHIEKRRRLEESIQSLSLNEIEFEERAANVQMAGGLDRLDDQEEVRLAAIEHALDRLRLGEYETCESCGGTISTKRLEAIPWTTQCIACAKGEKDGVAEKENL